jgi:hypothetical protein
VAASMLLLVASFLFLKLVEQLSQPRVAA